MTPGDAVYLKTETISAGGAESGIDPASSKIKSKISNGRLCPIALTFNKFCRPDVIYKRSGFQKHCIHITNRMLLKEQELGLLAPLPLRNVLKAVDVPPDQLAELGRRLQQGKITARPSIYAELVRAFLVPILYQL
jgi:hypothetical protein